MGTGFWLSDLVLCAVQGLLVMLPRKAVPSGSRLIGLLVPAGLLVLGVLLVRAADGARVLTDLASFGTPVAAGMTGFLLRWRKPWSAAIGAAALYLIAWFGSGLVRDAASVALIALACLSAAALAGTLIGTREFAVGLVFLVCLDVVLVFATSQITETTETLHGIVPPTVGAHPLPALQDVTFGGAMMGWLDLLAPALLGVALFGSSRRSLAAIAVTISGLAWAGLLFTTSTIPATVPVLVGLAVGYWPARRKVGSGKRVRPVRTQRVVA